MLEKVISNKTGWTRVAFGDVVRLSKLRAKAPEAEGYERVVGLEHIEPGDLRIRRWADIADGTTFTSVFQPGQVLFGKRRAYQRKVAVADFEGVCSGDIYVLEPSSDALMPELLPFICQTDAFFDHAVGTSAGSLSPRTNWKSLADFEFLLPPVQEQERLVEALKASEEVSETLYQLVLQIGQLRQATLNHFAMLAGAAQVKLDEICEMQNGRPFPGDSYISEGIRLLRPGNLGISGYLEWSEKATKHLPKHFEDEAQAFVVDQGDLVINLTAQSLEEGFMGRVCFAREGDKSLLNQRIGRFCEFSDSILPEFMFRVLQSSRFQTHAIRMCEGSKIKHLFWQHLAPFQIPLPDREKQMQVVEACRGMDQRLHEAQKRQQHVLLDRAKFFDFLASELMPKL